MTQLSLELSSFTSFPNWGSRRKNLGFRPVSCRVVLHVRDYFKGCRDEASFIGRKCEFNILFMENKGFLGTTFALPWALEESTLDSNVAKGGLDHDMIEHTHGHLSESLDVSSKPANDDTGEDKDENHEDDDGQNRGIDHWKEDRSGSSGRIDVRALAWSLHLAKTEDDIEEVLKEKGELPLQVYCTIIKGFGKDKRLDSAMALFKWLKRRSKETGSHIQLNLYIFNSLLGAMKQAENFKFLEEVLNDMATEGVCPNVVTYNTLMGIYIEQGRELRALQLFVEMPIRGVSPSPASYSTVLLAYRRLEDGCGAITLFLDIRSNYQKGEIGKSSGEDWSYEIVKLEKFTLRICHQVMRRWLVTTRENLSTKVLKFLIDMDKAGMQLGRAEYERLLWACTREEHCAVAKEFYARIRGMNVGISLSVCNHIIWLMGKAKKWWAALEIYEDLLDKGPKPNNMSYELVVSHFNILLTAARKRA